MRVAIECAGFTRARPTSSEEAWRPSNIRAESRNSATSDLRHDRPWLLSVSMPSRLFGNSKALAAYGFPESHFGFLCADRYASLLAQTSSS